ncbi:thymidine phosphorylase [Rhodoferax sp.]|uniref:thymidine phosphorylase n=1 Tax=Rhodoferax sp. TaxID=50421 RepID=UPI00272FBD18|nr:thymidine phosphorylase [Rhodoferax sp.]MDP1530541.1 thymidine phosphorylase [Rhodoferax sp.]MDP1944604.1 thymidine phosphorylase [Rhodoferax sp.]MDP2440611.1 thymidine phosphorylase [Rhodoferax sp.]MDZ4208962.1 thymidine phosphorylase [Rhodoferax sp.]
MLAQEIIRIKRDGQTLARSHIDAFVRGLVDGSWSEGQAAALAMAMFLKGMSRAETVDLTLAMTHSGLVMDWRTAHLHGPVLDKHSTGGVGDKVSLMLAPIVAACGGVVPMISGRGLGHTGGTLDKLASIPGYQCAPDVPTLHRALHSAGCAIIGQTAELAPADRRLYAIRDVTATVESVPLITASILSKKLAAGLQALVMDVKVGNGAFADSFDMATTLAESLVQVANGAGLPTRAWLTDMNQVLGSTCGNALEVLEAVEFLTGQWREPRLLEVTRTLSAELLVMGGLAGNDAQALQQVDAALRSGRALEQFARMVTALGGPTDLCEHPGHYLPKAPVQLPVLAPHSGFVAGMATRDIGLAVVELGGGRRQAGDTIDARVGLSQFVQLGQAVQAGAVLAVVHAADRGAAEQARRSLLTLLQIAPQAPASAPVLVKRLLA